MTWLLLASGDAPWWKATLVQIFGFAILVAILVKLVLPALGKILGGRTKGIEDSFAKVEKETAEASKELAELKRRVTEVDQEARRREEASTAEAEKMRAQALADAATQAQGILDKARREIQTERDKAVLELRQEAQQLTLAAADHLAQAAMNDDLHQKLVDGYLGKIEKAGGA